MPQYCRATPAERVRERIQAILLLDAGNNRDQVARILHVNAKTITRWVQIFVRSGIDILRTVELKTNTGRSRLNVLGAYSPDDQTLVAIEDTITCDAQMVCQLLHKLRATNPDVPILVVRDNARYQRAYRVQALAEELQITLLFLPPYSPNLNLIERFWKFLRKHVTRNRFYATFGEFRTAIQHLLHNLGDYADELASLMTENFHLFGQTA